MTTSPEPFQTSPIAQASKLSDLLRGLLARPQQLLLLWNWKSAVLSMILRGPIFLIATVRQGWRAAAGALVTESIFCVFSAGFYGAVVQILKDAEPRWLTGIFLTVAMPVTFQILEYLLHWFRGTPHLRIAAIVSLAVGAVSASFNWYAMRRGTLLVGSEAGGFGGDLRRLPRLLFGFLAVLPRRIVGRRKAGKSRSRPKFKAGVMCGDPRKERQTSL
jgi:hypothetical protein